MNPDEIISTKDLINKLAPEAKKSNRELFLRAQEDGRIKEGMQIRVRRSNGQIEDDWNIVTLVPKDSKAEAVLIAQKSDGRSIRPITLENFLALNAGLLSLPGSGKPRPELLKIPTTAFFAAANERHGSFSALERAIGTYFSEEYGQEDGEGAAIIKHMRNWREALSDKKKTFEQVSKEIDEIIPKVADIRAAIRMVLQDALWSGRS